MEHYTLIETVTNECGMEARIVQLSSDKKYIIELWDTDLDLMACGGRYVYKTYCPLLASKKAREIVDTIGPQEKMVR